MSTSLVLEDTSIENIRQILAGFKEDEVVNVYSIGMDELEQRIHAGGLRIKTLHFHGDMDLMLIVLNNKKVLSYPISLSHRLSQATEEQQNNYQLIGNGIGIHWPDVDEDLSLKGFLRREVSLSIDMVLGTS